VVTQRSVVGDSPSHPCLIPLRWRLLEKSFGRESFRDRLGTVLYALYADVHPSEIV